MKRSLGAWPAHLFRQIGPLLGGLGLLGLVLSGGCASANVRHKDADSLPAPDLMRPEAALETFDAAWRIIDETYFDTNFHGVDWASMREEFRPQAKAASSAEELRKVIENMLSRLGQSHMAVIPNSVADAIDPEASDEEDAGGDEEGEIGFEVRLWNRQMVVSRVDPGSPADLAGIKPGWIVQAVGPSDVSERLSLLPGADARRAEFLAWRMMRKWLTGQPGTQVQIRFLDGRNEERTLDLRRRPSQAEPTKLGSLPKMFVQFQKRRLPSEAGGEIGYVHFNYWMIPVAMQFDAAIDEFRKAGGIIIDLRGNLGGMAGMVMGLAGHFLKERVSLGTMKMRGNEIQFYANPRFSNPANERVEPFSGPVAILTDSISLSAAEIFAGGLQAIGRARVFGETSGGQALPALWDRLPNGDVLYHAFADYITPTNERLEGRGVVPDETVALTREDLLAGRDAALLAAMRWIERQAKRE